MAWSREAPKWENDLKYKISSVGCAEYELKWRFPHWNVCDQKTPAPRLLMKSEAKERSSMLSSRERKTYFQLNLMWHTLFFLWATECGSPNLPIFRSHSNKLQSIRLRMAPGKVTIDESRSDIDGLQCHLGKVGFRRFGKALTLSAHTMREATDYLASPSAFQRECAIYMRVAWRSGMTRHSLQ